MTSKRTRGELIRDTQGVVFLEFLVSFIPVWTFFLCIVQLGMIAHANMIVRHAADAAARSAMVVLPDDPFHYGGERQRRVESGIVNTSEITGILADIADNIYEDFLGGLRDVMTGGSLPDPQGIPEAIRGIVDTFTSRSRGAIRGALAGSRSKAIAMAVHVPLMPLAPQDLLGRSTVERSLSSGTGALNSFLYNPLAVSIDYPDAENEILPDDVKEVRVRVTYAYRCSVPLARKIACTDSLGGMAGAIEAVINGGSYKTLQHEAILLVQDAPYEYKEEE